MTSKTFTYGRCDFCAAKGYERRKLLYTPTGLRCSACMNVVTPKEGS